MADEEIGNNEEAIGLTKLLGNKEEEGSGADTAPAPRKVAPFAGVDVVKLLPALNETAAGASHQELRCFPSFGTSKLGTTYNSVNQTDAK